MDRSRRGGSVLSAEGAKGEVRILEPTAAERTVARRAAESRATVPTIELTVELPADSHSVSTARLVHACGRALRAHPRANAAYRDGRFELYSRVNVGVVWTDPERYVVPTVFDADQKSAAELETELETLSQEVGNLPSSAFSGATFTVWDAARHGLAAAAVPVVPPQAAALAAGAAALTLTCDHRILYGATAAAFLQTVANYLDGDGV